MVGWTGRVVGAVLAVLGWTMLVAPGAAYWVLRALGMHADPHNASKVGAWGLLLLGGIIVLLSRFG